MGNHIHPLISDRLVSVLQQKRSALDAQLADTLARVIEHTAMVDRVLDDLSETIDDPSLNRLRIKTRGAHLLLKQLPDDGDRWNATMGHVREVLDDVQKCMLELKRKHPDKVR